MSKIIVLLFDSLDSLNLWSVWPGSSLRLKLLVIGFGSHWCRLLNPRWNFAGWRNNRVVSKVLNVLQFQCTDFGSDRRSGYRHSRFRASQFYLWRSSKYGLRASESLSRIWNKSEIHVILLGLRILLFFVEVFKEFLRLCILRSLWMLHIHWNGVVTVTAMYRNWTCSLSQAVAHSGWGCGTFSQIIIKIFGCRDSYLRVFTYGGSLSLKWFIYSLLLFLFNFLNFFEVVIPLSFCSAFYDKYLLKCCKPGVYYITFY